MSDTPLDDRPRVTPHPRIRQRRIEVRRDEGRRRLRALVALLVAVVAGASAYGTTRSPLLDVDHVHVRGAAQAPVADVVRAAGHGRQMIDLDEHRLAIAIERIPWVQAADVTKRWPGTVEVTLRERTPLAAIVRADGTTSIVDQSGRVLEIRAEPAPELFRVESTSAAGGAGSIVSRANRGALAVVASLPDVLAGRVPSVVVHEDATLELRLDGKVTVVFGPARDIRAKLVALTTVVQKTDLRRVRAIDVRVPTAPVLTRG